MKAEGLTDKRVLITGATSAIGSAIARSFAENGAIVGLHYRDSHERANELLGEMQKKSGNAKTFQADLSNLRETERLLEVFVKEFRGIDILVNNAGAAYEYKHFSEVGEKTWDMTYNLNVKAPFFLGSRAFVHMKSQKWGRILNISSVSVNYAGANSLHYTSSKAALDMLTSGFAKDGAQYNILANSIRCGVIETSMHNRVSNYTEEQYRKRIAMIPLKRPGLPIEVAQMVVFLASEYGNFITGEIFPVAGGE